MAITFEATYAKKLGLPNYSSHQYSVTIRTELTDLSTVEEASTRLYGILQDAVDREIQHVGFIPDASTYGMKNGSGQGTNSGSAHGSAVNGNGHDTNGEAWACTDGQKKLILQLVHDNQLDKQEIEADAQQMFGCGVKELNKLQASGLIDEILERLGKKPVQRRPRWKNRERARS
jgi:hypothetical protein